MKIDCIDLGKRVVCGYNAVYATAEELEEGHSSNGYALETFKTVDEAVAWYAEYYPNAQIRAFSRDVLLRRR